MSNYSDNLNSSLKFSPSSQGVVSGGDDLNPPAKSTAAAAATLNLFTKNFTTYMKYSDSNQTLDINMALASANSTSTNSEPNQPPTVLLKNANSYELDQFKAELLFNNNNNNNTKETRLNDLLAAANLTLNESKATQGLTFLKRQSNAIQANLFQYCDTNSTPSTSNTTAASTTSQLFNTNLNNNNNNKAQLKKEINTIAIDQVLDKLTNSIKNDKKLASNIRFATATSEQETKSSVCSSSSSVSHSSSSSSSSASSSSSSSRTESNDKPTQSNLISLNLLNNNNNNSSSSNSTSNANNNAKPLGPSTPKLNQSLSTSFPTPLSTPTTLDHHNHNQTNGLFLPGATAASPSLFVQHHHQQYYHNNHQTNHQQQQSKTQFNIENELIKYTKNLKLNNQPYTDFYKLGAHIRNGGFSEIYEGAHLKSSEKVIVKLIPKRKTKNWLMVHNKKYPAEILLHKMSNNIKGVVRMLEFYEQENEWVIIMPKLYNCMDLFDYLESKQRGRLSETEACHFFTQLVRINIDLLSQGVVHRDIKSENILVDLDSMQLILIDFGASAICRTHSTTSANNNNSNSNSNTNKSKENLNQHFYTDFHGTRQYKPPEYITNKKYTALASTIWTLGILLYDMCNGQLPFETEEEILEYNLQIKANVSEEYKQLLYDCLKLDPVLRPSLDQVLEYAWCVNNTKQFQLQQQQQQQQMQQTSISTSSNSEQSTTTVSSPTSLILN